MANCSFINASEARNIARNNTLIWEEICEIQTQILAGIDANVYSILVNDGTPFTAISSILSADVVLGGTNYLPVEATATIGAGGTGGTGALVTPVVTGTTVTGFTIDNGGDLTLQSAAPTVAGASYAIAEVLTLDGTGATATTDATVSVTALTTIATQDETDYAASFNGVAASGAYQVSDVITLDDGSTITVDAVAGADVTEFTVTTATTIGITGDLATLSQLGAVVGGGNGTGFTLTQQLTNQGVFTVAVTVAGLYTVVPTQNPDTTTSAGAGAGALVSWVITAGYAPISVSASVDNANDLIDGQDETNFNGTLPDGDFNAGDSYRIGEVISLVDASTVTVDNISATGVVTTISQDEGDWTITAGGDGIGGTAYAVGDVITLNDGTQVTVAAGGVDVNGDVTLFDVTRASTSSYTSGGTLFQVGQVVGTGNGLGFTLLSAGGNEITVGTVTEFTTASAGSTPYYQTTLLQLSTDGIGSAFTLTPAGNNQVTSVQGTGVSLVVTETGGAVTNVTAAGGSGYLVGATLSFTHPTGNNAAATVTAVLAGGIISVITISNGGSGYEQAVATVTVVTPDPAATPAIAFVGTVVTTNGSVTGISIQEGGLGYAELLPTVSVTDATGSGAVLTTNVAGGAVTAINVDSGGSGYTAPTLTIVAAATSSGAGATATATIGSGFASTTSPNNTPTDIYNVLAGLTSDAVISDQIQYILDYFTSLGYNIRAQTNSTTTNTMQWQIIW